MEKHGSLLGHQRRQTAFRLWLFAPFFTVNMHNYLHNIYNMGPLFGLSDTDNKQLGLRQNKQTAEWEVSESFSARFPAGDSFLALSGMWNSNPRGEAKCSEHIVSAQM